MHQVTLLRDALRPHLTWHGARLRFLAAFLIALLRVKTINLAELATAFSGSAQTTNGSSGFSATMPSIMLRSPKPWWLSWDRTQWQFGEHTFNILMLGVVHEGIAFPVVWCLLDKPGNSNTDERIELFNQFLECFGEQELACLTADREFIGKDWLSYLRQEPRTPFRIRIRHNHILGKGRQRLKVSAVFQALQPGQHQVPRHKRQLWGHWLYITALRLEDGTLLVVATQSAPKSAIRD